MQNNMKQSQWLHAVGLTNAHRLPLPPSPPYWESSWITKDFQHGSVERLPNFVNGICEKASVKCAILALRFQRAVSTALQSLLRRQADSSDLSVLRRRGEGRKIARLTGRKKYILPPLTKKICQPQFLPKKKTGASSCSFSSSSLILWRSCSAHSCPTYLHLPKKGTLYLCPSLFQLPMIAWPILPGPANTHLKNRLDMHGGCQPQFRMQWFISEVLTRTPKGGLAMLYRQLWGPAFAPVHCQLQHHHLPFSMYELHPRAWSNQSLHSQT